MTALHQDELRRRPTGQLVKDLAELGSTLVRKEIELAKTEMTEKGKRAGVGMGALAGAAVAGLLALGALTAMLVLVLETVMPGWLAALCVTALWALVATALGLYGRDAVRAAGAPVPEKTVESVKEDIEWLKHPTS